MSKILASIENKLQFFWNTMFGVLSWLSFDNNFVDFFAISNLIRLQVMGSCYCWNVCTGLRSFPNFEFIANKRHFRTIYSAVRGYSEFFYFLTCEFNSATLLKPSIQSTKLLMIRGSKTSPYTVFHVIMYFQPGAPDCEDHWHPQFSMII